VSRVSARERSSASAVGSFAGRLELTERLLGCDVPAECAAYALAWLADAMPLERCFCAALSEDGESLDGLAGIGVPVADVEAFSLPLATASTP
jgi:hypothetical protein